MCMKYTFWFSNHESPCTSCLGVRFFTHQIFMDRLRACRRPAGAGEPEQGRSLALGCLEPRRAGGVARVPAVAVRQPSRAQCPRGGWLVWAQAPGLVRGGLLSGRRLAGQVLSCCEVSVRVGVGITPAWDSAHGLCGGRGVFEEVGGGCASSGEGRESKGWGLGDSLFVRQRTAGRGGSLQECGSPSLPAHSCQPGLGFGTCQARGTHECPRGRAPPPCPL